MEILCSSSVFSGTGFCTCVSCPPIPQTFKLGPLAVVILPGTTMNLSSPFPEAAAASHIGLLSASICRLGHFGGLDALRAECLHRQLTQSSWRLVMGLHTYRLNIAKLLSDVRVLNLIMSCFFPLPRKPFPLKNSEPPAPT